MHSRVFEKDSLDILRSALDELEEGFADLPSSAVHIRNKKSFEKVMREVAERMKNNYPYFHPLYAGQMLKPAHPIARVAYMLSMWINPNNHALDGGRPSSRMEKEAVAEIAEMFGWKTHLGHLTGGGTMANLEALWVAGQLAPGKKVVASEQAHYTHSRISAVLGLEFESIQCDGRGRMDLAALRKKLDTGAIGTVVATIGTTGLGAIDPLPELLGLREHYGFRLHADSAYGGYYVLAENLTEETRKVYDRIGESDSIVVDPHKHGLQPYACGCVIFRDPTVARFYKHDSPYTYFTSEELHLGEISLECSRAGASAVGLWATQRLLPLVRRGEFARSLESCREAALELYGRIQSDERFISPFPPELDIVVWAPVANAVTKASALSRAIFDEAAKQNLHLALVELPAALFDLESVGMKRDAETITCLRSVLMKPEHKKWIGRLWRILDNSTTNAIRQLGFERNS
jgi:tyrosine decarboxylase / aspartate 1-decarboxylase